MMTVKTITDAMTMWAENYAKEHGLKCRIKCVERSDLPMLTMEIYIHPDGMPPLEAPSVSEARAEEVKRLTAMLGEGATQ